MTQTLRIKLTKFLITALTVGGALYISMQPTVLINAQESVLIAATTNCDGTDSGTGVTTGDPSCTDVCKIFGNCPPALSNATAGQEKKAIIGIVNTVANALIGLAALVSVFFIIYAGWMILSGGGEGKADGIKKGQEIIINAFIGLAVSILSFVIVRYMVGFLNTLFS